MSGQPSPFALAVGYWAGLGAPIAAIAAALRTTPAAVEACLASGDAPVPALAGYPSAVAWEARTASALIHRGLARPAGQQLVFVAGEGAMTVGEVRAAVGRVAAGLAGAGVGKGSAVAVDATQRLDAWLVVVATLLLGGVVVRLSLAGGIDGVRAMLTAAPAVLTFSVHAGDLGGFEPAGASIDLGGDGDGFDAWLDGCPDSEALPVTAVYPGDPALAGFTSGSTGVPKAVITSHGAVFRSSEAVAALFGFAADDIFATSTDFSALSAFRSMLTLPLLCGGRVLLPSAAGREAPLALAAECAAAGVTRLTAIPNVLRGLARAGRRGAPMPDLRMVFSGSGVLDQASRDAAHAALGVPIVDYYGGREFATAVYSRADGDRTVSSGGGIACNALVRIIDDVGAVVRDGAVGGIMVHSDCLALAGVAGSRPAWAGWHESGDLGRITADGGIEVVGRARDIIKAADGSLVFPAELENLLLEVDNVKEACIFGVVGGDGMERIIAVVTLATPAPVSPGEPAAVEGMAVEAMAVEAMARRHLLAAAGRFRVPARVLTVTEFPRVGAGKIDKTELRRQLAARLDLD